MAGLARIHDLGVSRFRACRVQGWFGRVLALSGLEIFGVLGFRGLEVWVSGISLLLVQGLRF